MRWTKASECRSCTHEWRSVWGHCHLRVRAALSIKSSRSKAASVGTPLHAQEHWTCRMLTSIWRTTST